MVVVEGAASDEFGLIEGGVLPQSCISINRGSLPPL